jgi:tRNA nucleotidyltransferase (CCA-adding enzyme)
MPLTNTQICYYDHNVLRLPQDKRMIYNAQVDRLIASMMAKVREHTEYQISRVIKAGSFAKHTILRKAPGVDVDVDVAFYLKDRSLEGETYEKLSEEIYAFLLSVYPSKDVEDFQIQKRAATVRFVGTGLYVDIVPVIEIPNSGGQGWQYSLDGSRVKTCVPGQLEFIAARKRTDSDFRTLVRLAKQWRHHKEVPVLKGYSIELITAFLLDRDGTAGSVEERFRRFLLYIGQTGLKDTISFRENTWPLGTFSDPVVILDPVNSDNNVGGRIEEGERGTIAQTAIESWETAHFASQEGDLEIWKEVFGPRFRVEN